MLPKNSRLIYFPMCLGVLHRSGIIEIIERWPSEKYPHFNNRALFDAYDFFQIFWVWGAKVSQWTVENYLGSNF